MTSCDACTLTVAMGERSCTVHVLALAYAEFDLQFPTKGKVIYVLLAVNLSAKPVVMAIVNSGPSMAFDVATCPGC